MKRVLRTSHNPMVSQNVEWKSANNFCRNVTWNGRPFSKVFWSGEIRRDQVVSAQLSLCLVELKRHLYLSYPRNIRIWTRPKHPRTWYVQKDKDVKKAFDWKSHILPELHVRNRVLIQDVSSGKWTKEGEIRQSLGRSYVIQLAEVGELRRNRRFICKLWEPAKSWFFLLVYFAAISWREVLGCANIL